MLPRPTSLVHGITDLHASTVAAWHERPIENPHDGLLGVVCQQHQFNFLLWHEEDVARSPNVGDARIAAVKRAIDGYNQQRNDWIEKIDQWLIHALAESGVAASPRAKLNTETPGSAIDRLSIMSLRIYHLDEQLLRTDVQADHLHKVRERLNLCHEQKKDLATSLADLLDDIFSGRKRMRLYRQLKMYNDPTLNPYLYRKAS